MAGRFVEKRVIIIGADRALVVPMDVRGIDAGGDC